MAKENFLHIRRSRKDKNRIEAVASANYLDTSTWARMVIMKAVELVEKERAAPDSSEA